MRSFSFVSFCKTNLFINISKIMKKALLLIIALFFSLSAFADQLQWLSKKEAQTAVTFLQKQKVVLLYCGCCDSDPMRYVKITNVTIQSTGFEGYYEVVLQGIDNYGKEVSEAIDLAYTHIQNNTVAVCVGLLLGMECDPCQDNIPWKTPTFK